MSAPSLPEKTTSSPPPKLLDQVVAKIRFKHYSRRTEQSYAHWIKRFILFHGKRHPKEMGALEIGVVQNWRFCRYTDERNRPRMNAGIQKSVTQL